MVKPKSGKRPKLKLPYTPMQILAIMLGLFGVLTSCLILIKAWQILPPKIPTHFGFNGTPDAWGGKNKLLIEPLVGGVTFLGMLVLSRFPHIYNYPVTITVENAPVQYQMARSFLLWLATGLTWMFAYVEWITVQTALSKAQGLGSGFILGLILVSTVPLIVYLIQASQAR